LPTQLHGPGLPGSCARRGASPVRAESEIRGPSCDLRSGCWIAAGETQMTAALDFEQDLSRGFFTTLLLTGNLADAEAALGDAIDAVQPEPASNDSLLRRAVEAAVKLPLVSTRDDLANSRLPPELKRVLSLPAAMRRCFVLRILAATPRDECAELLQIGTDHVDELTCLAARELSRIAASESRAMDFSGLEAKVKP